jgi:hypothetical protein
MVTEAKGWDVFTNSISFAVHTATANWAFGDMFYVNTDQSISNGPQ